MEIIAFGTIEAIIKEHEEILLSSKNELQTLKNQLKFNLNTENFTQMQLNASKASTLVTRISLEQHEIENYKSLLEQVKNEYPKVTIYSNGELKPVWVTKQFFSYLEEYLKDEDIDLNSGYLLQDHFDIYADDYRKATGNNPIIH